MYDKETKGEELFRNYNLLILEYNFEILSEEDEEIDIDSIKKLLKIEEYEVDKTDTVINRDAINQLIKAVKQLNRRLGEIDE